MSFEKIRQNITKHDKNRQAKKHVFQAFCGKEKINKTLQQVLGPQPPKVRTRCTKYNGFLLEQEANNMKSFT